MPKNKDGYFRSTFTVGKNADGKPQRITVRAKTKRELDEKLAEAKRLHAKGIAGTMTVREWAARWLSVCKANASDGQKKHYAAKLNLDILPAIGGMWIQDVRASHLQELLNAYAGGKTNTIKKIKIAIKQLFDDAEIEGLVDRNPARRLELPKTTERTRRPLTDFERSVVYAVAKTHKAGAYMATMLFCGLRRGECAALLISDIDLDRRRISISKSLDLQKNIGREKAPKSKAGIREVPIPDILAPILASQCAGKERGDILFPKLDGKHATNQASRWWWRSFKRQCHLLAGAKVYRNQIKESPFSDVITPHYLRHTYATDLYAAGVDEKAQKSFLGHSSGDVTDIYRQMNDAAFERAAKQLNEYYCKLEWTL
jgi:integrase